MADNSAYVSTSQSSSPAGQPVTFQYGRQIYVCWYQNGADVGSRTPFTVALGSSTGLNVQAPATPGTYTVRAYDAQTGGNLLAEGAPVTVTSPSVSPAALVAAT